MAKPWDRVTLKQLLRDAAEGHTERYIAATGTYTVPPQLETQEEAA